MCRCLIRLREGHSTRWSSLTRRWIESDMPPLLPPLPPPFSPAVRPLQIAFGFLFGCLEGDPHTMMAEVPAVVASLERPRRAPAKRRSGI